MLPLTWPYIATTIIKLSSTFIYDSLKGIPAIGILLFCESSANCNDFLRRKRPREAPAISTDNRQSMAATINQVRHGTHQINETDTVSLTTPSQIELLPFLVIVL